MSNMPWYGMCARCREALGPYRGFGDLWCSRCRGALLLGELDKQREVAKVASPAKKETRMVAKKTTQAPLQKALSEMLHECGYVQKDAKNSFHKYKYASADAVLTKVREAASARGVCISEARAEVVEFLSGADHKGKPQNTAIVKVTQTYSLGEESATFEGLGCGSDANDKAIMKANTAALKYLLSLAFNISWGDDPEADTSTDASSSDAKPAAKASPARKGGKAKPPSDADLLKHIKAAATEEALNKLRAGVLKLKDGQPELFEKYKAAVVARRQELTQSA